MFTRGCLSQGRFHSIPLCLQQFAIPCQSLFAMLLTRLAERMSILHAVSTQNWSKKNNLLFYATDTALSKFVLEKNELTVSVSSGLWFLKLQLTTDVDKGKFDYDKSEITKIQLDLFVD